MSQGWLFCPLSRININTTATTTTTSYIHTILLWTRTVFVWGCGLGKKLFYSFFQTRAYLDRRRSSLKLCWFFLFLFAFRPSFFFPELAAHNICARQILRGGARFFRNQNSWLCCYNTENGTNVHAMLCAVLNMPYNVNSDARSCSTVIL